MEPPTLNSTSIIDPAPLGGPSDGPAARRLPDTWFPTVAAIFGSTLVMASAVAAAAARWGHVSMTARLSMLVALQLVVTGVAEYVTKRLLIVGRVLDHLCAYLALPTAITCSAQLGGSWRTNIAIGGLVSAVAVLVQGRRRSAPFLLGSTALAMVVTASGVAATTGVPLAILVSGLGIGFAAMGSRKRSTLLAGIALTSPVMGIVADYGVGRGTLREMGVVGPAVPGAGIVAGLVCTLALLSIARVDRSRHYVFAALGSFVSSLAWALHTLTLPRIDGALVLGLALIALEISVLAAERSSLAQVRSAAKYFVPTIDVLEVLFVLAAASRATRSPVSWTVLAIGFGLGTMRRARSIDLVFPAIASSTMAGASAGILFPSHSWMVGVAITALALAGFSALHRRATLAHLSAVSSSCLVVVAAMDLTSDRMVSSVIIGVLGLVAVAINLIRPTWRLTLSFGLAAIGFVPLASLTWISLAAAGAVWFGIGMIRRMIAVELIGVIFVAGGLLGSLSSGNGQVHDDASTLVLLGLLVLGEFVARRHCLLETSVPSYVPPIVAGSIYLVESAVGASSARVGAVAAIGIAMSLAATLLRHRLTLVSGIIVASSAVILATDERLRSLPTWVWAMVGGLTLLGVAGFVERRRQASPES